MHDDETEEEVEEPEVEESDLDQEDVDAGIDFEVVYSPAGQPWYIQGRGGQLQISGPVTPKKEDDGPFAVKLDTNMRMLKFAELQHFDGCIASALCLSHDAYDKLVSKMVAANYVL